VFFLIYLRAKDPLEYNGTESYIAEKLENEDLTWFPLNRAMSLDLKDVKEERNVMSIVSEKLHNFELKLNEALAKYSPVNANAAAVEKAN